MGDASMTVGNVEVSHLYDLVADMPMTLDQLFPTVPAEAWEPYRREYPGLFGSGNTWRYHAGCYLIRSAGRTILVDTGVGPSSLGLATWLGTGGELPEPTPRGRRLPRGCGDGGVHPSAPGPRRLEPPAGRGPVPADLPARSLRGPPGGLGDLPSTRGAGGRWKGSPRALSRRRSRRWRPWACWTWPTASAASPRRSPLLHTPGHTPGSMSLLITSGAERAIIVGDAIAHPAQVEHPDWGVRLRLRRRDRLRTRSQLLDRIEAEGLTMTACHFPEPGFGRVVRLEGRRYWQASLAARLYRSPDGWWIASRRQPSFGHGETGGCKRQPLSNHQLASLETIVQSASAYGDPVDTDSYQKLAPAPTLSRYSCMHARRYAVNGARDSRGKVQGESAMTASIVRESQYAERPARVTGGSTIITSDGTQIYYKDWGKGPVVTFSHGWPLNADAWDGQMLFLAQNGFRVVAHDRRGHGRSSQASSGNDMNGYADDLAAVIETLDLKDVTLVGHSTGGGEVARYIGRHGTKRVAKAVLIAAVPPLMLKTAANPEGLPMEVFDGIRAALAKDRSQFYKDFAIAVLRRQPARARRSRRARSTSSGCGACRPASRTPTTASRRSPRPTSPRTSRSSTCRRWCCTARTTRSCRSTTRRGSRRGSSRARRTIYYPGAPHGITATHQDQINAELLAFLRS